MERFESGVMRSVVQPLPDWLVSWLVRQTGISNGVFRRRAGYLGMGSLITRRANWMGRMAFRAPKKRSERYLYRFESSA
jgi:hypothetical protein